MARNLNNGADIWTMEDKYIHYLCYKKKHPRHSKFTKKILLVFSDIFIIQSILPLKAYVIFFKFLQATKTTTTPITRLATENGNGGQETENARPSTLLSTDI